MCNNAVVLEVDGPRRLIRAGGVTYWVTSEYPEWLGRAFEEALLNFFARLEFKPAHENDYFRSTRIGVHAPAPGSV